MIQFDQHKQRTLQTNPEDYFNQEDDQPTETNMYQSLNYQKSHQPLSSQGYLANQHSKLFDLRKKYLKNREDTHRRSVSIHNKMQCNKSPIKTQQTKRQSSPKQENYQPLQKKKTMPVCKNLGSNLRNILKSNYQQQGSFGENPENAVIRKEYSQLIEIPIEYQGIDNYSFIKTLGIGATAEVKMARNKELDIEVAIKIYDRKKMNSMHLKNLEREVEILNLIKHPNIINLYHILIALKIFIKGKYMYRLNLIEFKWYTYENDKSIFLIMEYSSPINLETFMKGRPFKRINEDEAKILFRQIADAIAYIHMLNISHRDLKFENLLIDYNTRKVKIIDFGYSIKVDGKQTCSCGTPQYMAPELVKKSAYDQSVDVWACGVILYKILTGVFPFRGNSEKDLYRKICLGKLEYPSFVSNQARQLVSSMLRVDPNERACMQEVKLSQWLN